MRTIGHEELNLKFGRAGSFWLLATLLALLSAASSTPSPLYAVYAAQWHFSSITLTAIFGVYALALLAALLTTGRLSDHLGRRPVVLAGRGARLHRRQRRRMAVHGAHPARAGDGDGRGSDQRLAG